MDFSQKRLLHKPHRLWKVHLAGIALARRAKVRPHVVEVWLRRATALMRLCPSLLTAFEKIYRFVRIGGGRVPLWPAVRAEILCACNLIWLCHVDQGASFVRQVDMGDSATRGYAMMTSWAPPDKIRAARRFREKWRYVPMPDSLREIMQKEKNPMKDSIVYDFGVLEDGVRSTCPSRSADGLGLGTQYAKWLQEALQEGSWLRTSAMVSQFRAKKTIREDVEFPALVPPLDPELVDERKFTLLWAKSWKNSAEHIGMKEARVALSSLKRTARVASLAGLKKLTLSDNLPAVLCYEKGRSSRPGLIRLCRIAGAIQAGLGIRWRLRHIETKRNLADAPSCWFEGKRVDAAVRGAKTSTHTSVSSLGEGIDGTNQAVSSRDLNLTPHDLVQLNLFDALCDPSSDGGGEERCGECGHTVAEAPHMRRASPEQCSLPNRSQYRKRPPGLHKRGMFWELFSGTDHLTNAVKTLKLGTLPPIDLRNGAHHDLTRRATQVCVKKLILSENVSYVHLGTPRTAFSRARHHIKNQRTARERERVACELAFFSAEVARLCHAHDLHWSIENPASSRLWDFPAIRELMLLPGIHRINFPYCMYGADCKKPTSILTNCPLLQSLSRECPHKKHRQVLRGRVQVRHDDQYRWVNRTELAGAYPMCLCQKWAQTVKPLLIDVSEEPGSIAEHIRAKLSAASIARQGEFFPIISKFQAKLPALLDSVTFGQHTRAEATWRRQRRHRVGLQT